MRVLRMACIACCMLVMLTAQALAQYPAGSGFVENVDGGAVNWQNGVITAVGIGVPPPNAVSQAQARAMAVRAATVDARRNLLSVIKGVQIDSATTMQNFMVANDTVVERVRGFLQNSQILDTAYKSDGTIEVTVGVSMRGGLSSVMMPPDLGFKSQGNMEPMISSPIPQPPADTMAPVPAPLQNKVMEAKPAYTGLLIDARGLGIRPAMNPKVFDENGNEVYGSASVSRDYALKHGMAGYDKNIDAATGHPRVATAPVVIAAVGVKGKAKTNLVISNADAEKVRAMDSGAGFLEKCRVMIVLD